MGTITLTEDYGYNDYRVSGLAPGTTIDATGASWIQDNDSSDGQSNPYPFAVYDSPGVVLEGGTILGNINQTDAWRTVYDAGNSAGVRTEDTPDVVIRDWRITDTWDAIRVSWNSSDFVIEDIWASDIRDDAIENDRVQSGTIRDSLFDGAFGGISLDPSSSSPVDGSSETVLIDGVLLRLQPSLYNGEITHSSLIKTDSATNGAVTPDLVFVNNVFAIEDVDHRSYRSMFNAWEHTIESRDNYYLNLSDDPLPDDYPMPPAGWTVLQGQEARDYWEQARDEWIARHADGTVAVDLAPEAVDDSATTEMDIEVTIADVLANDDHGDGPAVISGFDSESVEGGTVTSDGSGALSYTPPTGFTGTDSFGYTIEDADGDRSSASVSVTVTETPPTEPETPPTDPVTPPTEPEIVPTEPEIVPTEPEILPTDPVTPPTAPEIVPTADPDVLPIVFETRVASGRDDVEERSSGSVQSGSTDLELVTDGSKDGRTIGIRFTDIDVPQDAVITNAYIQFQVDEIDTEVTSLMIHGENVGDSAAFSTTRFDVSSRSTTDASASWQPEIWTTIGEAGIDQRTPDLSAIVQEIVTHSDWAELNDMAFFVTGTGARTAEAYDGDRSGAPLLHVEYVMPTGVTASAESTAVLTADRFVFAVGSEIDTISDFTDNVDELHLDDALWGGNLTAEQVIATYTSSSDGNTLFHFGGADVLTVEGISDPNVLIDDIFIY